MPPLLIYILLLLSGKFFNLVGNFLWSGLTGNNFLSSRIKSIVRCTCKECIDNFSVHCCLSKFYLTFHNRFNILRYLIPFENWCYNCTVTQALGRFRFGIEVVQKLECCITNSRIRGALLSNAVTNLNGGGYRAFNTVFLPGKFRPCHQLGSGLYIRILDRPCDPLTLYHKKGFAVVVLRGVRTVVYQY